MTNNEFEINADFRTGIGDFPKIDIRPGIDCRERGIRESFQKQTKDMTKSFAALISINLKYPDGETVKYIISNTTIKDIAEAAAYADKFSKNGVGVSLTLTPFWCYGSETIDMDRDEFEKALVWTKKYCIEGTTLSEKPGLGAEEFPPGSTQKASCRLPFPGKTWLRAWNAFGMDKAGSDCRACRTYGALFE
ncbi:MAG: hypothetical protein GX876_05745 [Bacteroidales bacterium]|nr:hypothetical protein [Bacteroidales bacterium]